MRKGGIAGFDSNLLKEQHEAIFKGLNNMDDELINLDTNKNKDPFEGKSMQEVLKEKKEETEKILSNTKINQ
jgi:hypothetical protein